MSIMHQLEEAREQAGVSKAVLASRIGRTPNEVSLWLRGFRKPGIEAVEQMAAALGMQLVLAPEPDPADPYPDDPIPNPAGDGQVIGEFL